MHPMCCLAPDSCDKLAVVKDTEYDEYYCDEHARDYQVYEGPHEELGS